MKRLWRAAAIASALAIAGCAGAPEAAIRLEISRTDALLLTPDTLDIFAYGEGADCVALLTNIAARNDPQCTGSNDAESGTCYLTRVVINYEQGAHSEPIEISVGERRILVVGYFFGGVVAAGCADASVRDGQSTAVAIVLAAPQ